jgi:hypothetical protein
MFNHIPGSADTKMHVMRAEVTRVYDILTRHIVRKPESENWCHLRPKFIGSPDLIVWKHDKELVRNLVVNDGLHFNVVALVPHERDAILPMRWQFALWGRRSRLFWRTGTRTPSSTRFSILTGFPVTPLTATRLKNAACGFDMETRSCLSPVKLTAVARAPFFGNLITASGSRAELGAAQAVEQFLTQKLFKPTIVVNQ